MESEGRAGRWSRRFPVDGPCGDPVARGGVQAAVPPRGQGWPYGLVLVGRVTSQAPSLRLLTPLASLLLAVAAVAWVGVVVLARDMGSMPGTMGLGIGSFIAVWALMMAAMMLPSVTPFASLYTRTFGDDRGWRLAGFASGYLVVWIAAALPAYGLAWLAAGSRGSARPRQRCWR